MRRDEPLENFYETLPKDPDATVDVWLAEPPDDVKDAAREVQRAFAHLDWIVPAPRHFLHVLLRRGIDWTRVAPLRLEYGPPTAFHDAVVAEVRCDDLRALVRDPFFLPHVSLGYFSSARDAAPLREALLPLRERAMGSGVVGEVKLVRVPISPVTLLTPWTVLETVALRARASGSSRPCGR